MKTLVIIYLAVNAVIWLLRHIKIERARKESASLDSTYAIDRDRSRGSVSVLVAARNESGNIDRCLESLLRQDYEDLEIIAIDDRSEDDTGAIIDRMAEDSGGRLRGLHVDEVPTGWLGKPNAMRVGVERARGRWLCFTDADCLFLCPGTISIAVEFAEREGVDLLSILPVLETSSFWERVLQPVCSAVMMIWYRPERVNDPSDANAYANGAFMLFRRECYEAVGGHEAVRDQLNEDMKFARLVKSRGLKLHVVQNRDLYRTRMYDDFVSTFRGWSRIFYGCFGRVGRVAAAAMLGLMSVLPYVIFICGLVIAIVRGWELSRLGWQVLGLSGVAIVAQMSVIFRFYGLMGLKWPRPMTYPLGACIVLLMLLNAGYKFLGSKVIWRGREIRTGRSGGKLGTGS